MKPKELDNQGTITNKQWGMLKQLCLDTRGTFDPAKAWKLSKERAKEMIIELQTYQEKHYASRTK